MVKKNPPASAGDRRDTGLIPRSRRSPGGGHDSPLQCSCLQNPMDRGAWWATVHRVTKSDSIEVTSHTHTHTDTYTKLFYSVQFSHSVVSDSLRPHGLQHTRPPCPSSAPRVFYYYYTKKNYFVVYLKFTFNWGPCILSEEYFKNFIGV